MPISSIVFPDTVYKPQYDVTATFTVKQPYREERCIFVFLRQSSAPTSGLFRGYCYFNTSSKKICIYDGATFYEIEPLTRDQGCIYWVDSVRNFCQFNGTDLIGMSFSNAWNHVYLKTLSLTVQPSTAEIGEWYFNVSTSLLYVYLGPEGGWRSFTYNYQQNKYQFAYDDRLWYYSGSGRFDPFYQMLQFQESGGATLYQSHLASSEITFSYTLTYPGNDTATTKDVTVRWRDINNNGRYLPESGLMYETETIRGIQGRGGTCNRSLDWITALPTYPSTADEFQAKLECTPTSTDTASILVPIDTTGLLTSERYGCSWTLAKTGGEGGTFTELPLAQLVDMGYVTLTSTYNGANYNVSRQSFRLKYAGDYVLKAYIHFRNSGAIYYGWNSRSWRVYAESQPVIQVATSPAPSPDPTIYPPSYTVVLQDMTAETNPYQIPQQSITMDAGDSGNPESWTTTNPLSAVVSMIDQSHVYTGYGPYRPSLTIVDKNGTTSVAYAQFAPNKTKRTYTPTGWSAPVRLGYNGTYYYCAAGQTVTIRLDNDGVHVPVMLTAEAAIAGSPLPDVEWTYNLTNGSAAYSDTVTGSFAEFSLILAGSGNSAPVYTVVCHVKDGDTILAAFGFVVAISNEIIASETPVALQDFVVWLYDSSGNRIDRIMPTSAQYVDRFAHSSYCEFQVPMEYANMDRLQPGCQLSIGYLGKARLMVVTGFEEDSEDDRVKITATDAASYSLSARVATLATTSTLGNGYDTQTCSAEALLRYFAVSNARDGDRAISQLQIVGTCRNTGGRTTYSARYEDILTIFEDICSQSGLGWDSALQSATQNTFSLKVIEPADRTYNTAGTGIVFEDRKNGRGSATLGSYAAFSGANLAIAAGKGSGNTRQYHEFTRANYRTIVTSNQSTYPLKVTNGSHGTVSGKTYYACREMSTMVFGYFCPETSHWVPVTGMSGYEINLVELLTFTGTQRIDTGFYPNQNTAARIRYKANDSLTSQFIFGAYQGGWAESSFGIYYNNSGTAWSNYNTDTQFSPTPTLNGEHLAYQNKNILYIDGTQIMTHAASTFTSTVTIKLGTADGSPSWNGYTFKGYVKSLEIWNNGTLVRNLVPILYGTTYAMLDKVNWAVYGNVGSGTLTGGPVTGYVQYPDRITGMQRQEVFVDAGESADDLEIEREAETELGKQDERTIMVYPNESVYRLGTDYNVGDYVTVRTKSGIMLPVQVIQANCSLDETGKQLSLECGSDLRDYQKLIRETKLANTYARK